MTKEEIEEMRTDQEQIDDILDAAIMGYRILQADIDWLRSLALDGIKWRTRMNIKDLGTIEFEDGLDD